MKRFLFVLAVLTAAPALAQDCSVSFSITAAGSTSAFDNRTKGCITWTLAYNSTGFSGLTITLQGAPDSSGSPGAWSTITAATGSNPETTTSQNSATFATYFPWVRVTVSGLTGSGTIKGTAYGSRTGAQAGADPSGGGGGGGCTAPCVVIGPDAAGAAPTQSPVQNSLFDGSVIRRLLGTSAGRVVNQPKTVSLALADGISNTQPVFQGDDSGNTTPYVPTLGLVFNGTGWDRAPGNTVGFKIQGTIAVGASIAGFGNPLPTGVSDGSSARILRADTNGRLDPAGSSLSFADDRNNTQTMPQCGGAQCNDIAYLYGFDGSTWDRIRANSSAGLLIGGLATGTTQVLKGFAACDTSAVISVAASTTAVVISSGPSRMRICAFTLTSDTAAGTAQLIYGTGTTCGTGTVNLTGAYHLGTDRSIAIGSGIGELLSTPGISQDLCVVTGAGAVTGHISYAKF